MRGSLVPSLVGLAVFVGWSLLVSARERIAQRFAVHPVAVRTTSATRPLARLAPQLASDRLRWN